MLPADGVTFGDALEAPLSSLAVTKAERKAKVVFSGLLEIKDSSFTSEFTSR